MITKIKKILFEQIKLRIKYFGIAPICNLRADRAPRYKNISFPFCWRCTSFILTTLIINLFSINIKQNFIIGCICILPSVIDGIAQYKYKIESNNFKRIITGILASIAIKFIKI